MSRRSALVSCVFLCAAAFAGDSTMAAPPRVAVAQPKISYRQGGFLTVLQKGQRVVLKPVRNTAAYDVCILQRPYRKTDDAPYMVRSRPRLDYVTLIRKDRVVTLPRQSIRSIVEEKRDPLSGTVTADFQREPLQNFIRKIALAIGVEIRIDGDALKNSGYTKNIPHSATARKTPAEHLLAGLVKKLPQLVLTVHDDHYLLTTREFATRRMETVREVKPPKE